jgi:peptide/nickel transport system permease protein
MIVPPRAGVLKRLLRHRLSILALIVLAVLAIGSAGAHWLAPHDPEELDIANRYALPLTAGHILGSDDLGRDVLTRLMYAGQI